MKKGFLNNFANWILDKLATKVYNQLATSNKTMIGALNELNSNPFVKPARILDCGNVHLDTNGLYFLNESFPEIHGAKHIGIAYWSNINPMSSVSVYAGFDSRCYVFGSPNTEIEGLKIYYWK